MALRTHRTPAAAGTFLAALVVLATPAAPADGRTGGAAGSGGASRQADEPEPVERLEAWPELEDEALTKREIERLRRAQTELMGEEAALALRRIGAGAVPLLLRAYEKEREDAARGRVHAVLVAITGAPHTRLLARELQHRSPLVRVFCLERVAAHPDEGVREPAEQALASLVAQGEQADAQELYLAALCVTAAGSQAGLERVYERARDDWAAEGARIRTALEAVRGVEVSQRFARELVNPSKADRAERLALLHVLAGCGVEESIGAVRRYLDHDDAGLRIAAINALRGIVDGDPPIDKLPVFEAIEVANEWKRRL